MRAGRTALCLLFVGTSACTLQHAVLSPPKTAVDDTTPRGVDLRPGMELQVDGAYYREGSLRRSLADYLGDEIAKYEVGANGSLRLMSVSSLPAGKQPPHDQPAVQLLIGRRNASSRYHRLFFRVVFSQTGHPRQAILVGARSNAELDQITRQLADGQDPSCRERCGVFPEWSTASVIIAIVVNGVPRSVVLGSTVGSVAAHPLHITLLRDVNGRVTSVPVNTSDRWHFACLCSMGIGSLGTDSSGFYSNNIMTDVVEALIIDLLDWVASKERTYEEVMEAWRTSCPRLPVWEDANDRGLLAIEVVDRRSLVRLTPSGVALLGSRTLRR